MSPESGAMLLEEIAPRLRSAIPRVVKTVGAEDHEELVQDGITMAAQMLHNLEGRGKQVTPGNDALRYHMHLTDVLTMEREPVRGESASKYSNRRHDVVINGAKVWLIAREREKITGLNGRIREIEATLFDFERAMYHFVGPTSEIHEEARSIRGRFERLAEHVKELLLGV